MGKPLKVARAGVRSGTSKEAHPLKKLTWRRPVNTVPITTLICAVLAGILVAVFVPASYYPGASLARIDTRSYFVKQLNGVCTRDEMKKYIDLFTASTAPQTISSDKYNKYVTRFHICRLAAAVFPGSLPGTEQDVTTIRLLASALPKQPKAQRSQLALALGYDVETIADIVDHSDEEHKGVCMDLSKEIVQLSLRPMLSLEDLLGALRAYNLIGCSGRVEQSTRDKIVGNIFKMSHNDTGGIVYHGNRDATLTSTRIGIQTLAQMTALDAEWETPALATAVQDRARFFLRLCRLASGSFREAPVVYEDEFDPLPQASLSSAHAVLLARDLRVPSHHAAVERAVRLVQIHVAALVTEDRDAALDRILPILEVLHAFPDVDWDANVGKEEVVVVTSQLVFWCVVVAAVMWVSGLATPSAILTVTLATTSATFLVYVIEKTVLSIPLVIISCYLCSRGLLQDTIPALIAGIFFAADVLMCCSLSTMTRTGFVSGTVFTSLIAWEFVVVVAVCAIASYAMTRPQPINIATAFAFLAPIRSLTFLAVLHTTGLYPVMKQSCMLFHNGTVLVPLLWNQVVTLVQCAVGLLTATIAGRISDINHARVFAAKQD